MDKTPGPSRYERDGHSLTVESRFAGEKPLREVLRGYLEAARKEAKP